MFGGVKHFQDWLLFYDQQVAVEAYLDCPRERIRAEYYFRSLLQS